MPSKSGLSILIAILVLLVASMVLKDNDDSEPVVGAVGITAGSAGPGPDEPLLIPPPEGLPGDASASVGPAPEAGDTGIAGLAPESGDTGVSGPAPEDSLP